ncbi:membrane protein insertase YidC [Nibrella viscosa]|uniref:Membrane protein insertase YidC n=1 Tax=Nibrella viscosa TaxID=1084524 RepID=A0ABP8KSZ7_9BACT
MDRNQIIGIVLILAMLVGYQLLVPKPAPEKAPAQQTQTTKPTTTAANQAQAQAAPPTLDSVAARAQYGDFAAAGTGQAQDIVVENNEMKVTFSTYGGRPKEVLLKKYDTYTGKPVVLVDPQSTQTILELPTSRGKVDLHKLYYQTNAQGGMVRSGPRQLVFRVEVAPGQSVEQVYTFPAEGYVIDYDLRLNGLTNVGNDNIRFLWLDKMRQFENDLTENRKSATINYLTADGNFDNLSLDASGNHEASLQEPLQWYTLKHKYFLAGFIAKNSPLQNASLKTLVDPNDTEFVKTGIADVALPMADVKQGKGNYRFYFGPNDYQIVDGVAPEFDRNVYLGYAILKPINKYFFVPVFNLLERFISNYGLLIICLVVFVKLVLTPLTYKSYVSMAKMRVLQPEINEIREKVGDDMAKMQSEQMKLYQQVGVSPLSGCIPVLATMPILMSLFFLFPNLIELRQKPFLWANDLSTYDAFLQFPVTIPFLGSHLSLFTVLMTASSIAYAWYNNQMTPTQPGPVNMKAMSYIFPLMFMFVLNSFPAGLTFYYFVSNVVTIAQQQLIRKFVDEDKIKAVLEENRKKFEKGEGKKSKFQSILQRSLSAAEEARKQAEEAKRNAEQRPKQKK